MTSFVGQVGNLRRIVNPPGRCGSEPARGLLIRLRDAAASQPAVLTPPAAATPRSPIRRRLKQHPPTNLWRCSPQSTRWFESAP